MQFIVCIQNVYIVWGTCMPTYIADAKRWYYYTTETFVLVFSVHYDKLLF